MTPSPARRRIALVVDAENCGASLWPIARKALERLGDVVSVHAVAVTSICRWSAVPGVQPFLLGPEASGPNAADFALCCLAGRLTASGACDEVAILSGDNGFAALVRALRLLRVGVIAIVPVRAGRVPARLVQAAEVAVALDDRPSAETAACAHPLDLAAEVACLARELSGPAREWVPLTRLACALSQRGIRGLRGKLIAACQKAEGLEWDGAEGTLRVRPRCGAP